VTPDAEAAWDRECLLGRYQDEPPVAFVDDVLEAVRALGPGPAMGLYSTAPLRTCLELGAGCEPAITGSSPGGRS
jgi:hypothetical protein